MRKNERGEGKEGGMVYMLSLPINQNTYSGNQKDKEYRKFVYSCW